jgi:hypothetical protein
LEGHFSAREHLDEHLQQNHPSFISVRDSEIERERVHYMFKRSKCPVCAKKHRSRAKLQRHLQREHQQFYVCDQLGAGVDGGGFSQEDAIFFYLHEHAHNKTIKNYNARLQRMEPDLKSVLNRSRMSVFEIFRENLREFKNIKVWGHLRAHFHKNEDEITYNFTTFSHLILNSTQIPTVYSLICDYLTVQVSR